MNKDLEKVKTLLIKLDLKYQATKDKINANGIFALLDFDNEYRNFNTINALDVINELAEQLTEKDKRIAMLEIELKNKGDR